MTMLKPKGYRFNCPYKENIISVLYIFKRKLLHKHMKDTWCGWNIFQTRPSKLCGFCIYHIWTIIQLFQKYATCFFLSLVCMLCICVFVYLHFCICLFDIWEYHLWYPWIILFFKSMPYVGCFWQQQKSCLFERYKTNKVVTQRRQQDKGLTQKVYWP